MVPKYKRRAIAGVWTACCLPTLAMAQAEAPVTQLSDIVVTASGFEQSLQQAPASISVVTREDLATKPYRDVAEALRDVEGVDVLSSTGKTGGLDISIRGLPSAYTLILIDGRRQNVAGNVTPNGFDSALNSFIPPLSAIERIEVIRGPMSTLYGSDAIGGVINIITRPAPAAWGGSITLSASAPQSKKEGWDGRNSFTLGGPLVSDSLSLSVRSEWFRRQASERAWRASGNARDPRPAASRQYSVGTRLTWTPGRDHRLWLDVDSGRTWYDNRDCRLGGRDGLARDCVAPSSMVSGYKDHLRFTRDQSVFAYDGSWDNLSWQTSVSNVRTRTLGRTIPSAARMRGDPEIGQDRRLSTKGLTWDAKLLAEFGAHRVTLGGQVARNELVDGLLPQRLQSNTRALFLEDEWRLLPQVAATLGGRYTRLERFGGKLTPRAYLVWTPTENWTLKGGVSQGFKAPRLEQVVDGVSGISGQGRNINIGNPYLKPETATNAEVGLAFDNHRGLTAGLTLFQNRIRDRITSGVGVCGDVFISSCSVIVDERVRQRTTYAGNLDSAKTWGLEWTNSLPLSQALTLRWSYTWTDSSVVERGRRNGQLGNTPRHMASARLLWDVNESVNLWLRAEYRGASARFSGDPDRFTGSRLREYQAVGDLRGYSLLHLGGSYRVSERLSFSASVNNLLNKDFTRFKAWTDLDDDGQPYETYSPLYYAATASVRGTALPGRTFWLSANMTF